MAKFWFGLVFGIFPYIIDQSDIICGQNEALGHVITKKRFSRSPELIRPQIVGIWDHLVSKLKQFHT